MQEAEEEKEEPCSIVADEDGLVVEMVTRTGVPQVKPGDEVKKGDILVLGRLDLKMTVRKSSAMNMSMRTRTFI